MKRVKIYLIAFVAAAMGLSSCGNDFLSTTSPRGVFSEEFYRDEDEMMQALVAAYSPLQWEPYASPWGFNPTWFMSDVMGDDVMVGGGGVGDQKQMHDLRMFRLSPTNTLSGVWGSFYSGVNRTCHVTDHLPTAVMPDNVRARMRGEAIFLRSYYYYNLWRFFGNIPYYESVLSPPYTTGQLTAAEVYEKCVTALTDVLKTEALPKHVPDSELGRVTRAAAQMLKARFVMLQKDTARYPEVLADMKEIIADPAYKLYDNFDEMFQDKGEWCSESIFEFNFQDGPCTRDWGPGPDQVGGTVFPSLIGINGLANSPTFDGGWGFGTVNKALYDLYDDADQRKDGGILNFKKHADEVEAINMLNPLIKPADKRPEYSPRYQDTGYFLKKYLPRKNYNTVTSGPAGMNYRNNFRLFRYAETLLNAAEMVLRTGGSAGEAQGYLDEVRNRAFSGGAAPALAATIDNIITERRKEFIGEGLRFWDLVRTDKVASVLDPQRVWTANKRYVPIPVDEINVTKGTDHPLIQNPYEE